MQQQQPGSGTRWGPLFGARAGAWAQTWEGPHGWGTPLYVHVLDRAGIGPGTIVLDCGCGAGRFLGLAAQRGAAVAGIDASGDLAKIAATRTPRADIRVGDFEALPWPDKSFDVVTGFSTFQFADDHVAALTEARRVGRGPVWVIIPTRLADSGIPPVFAALTTLFPPDALPSLKRSGMYALSAPGMLDDVLAAAGMSPRSDQIIEATTVFPDSATAVNAFLSAGATALAIRHSSKPAVERAVQNTLAAFTGDRGQVTLPGWFRAVETD